MVVRSCRVEHSGCKEDKSSHLRAIVAELGHGYPLDLRGPESINKEGKAPAAKDSGEADRSKANGDQDSSEKNPPHWCPAGEARQRKLATVPERTT